MTKSVIKSIVVPFLMPFVKLSLKVIGYMAILLTYMANCLMVPPPPAIYPISTVSRDSQIQYNPIEKTAGQGVGIGSNVMSALL